MAIIFPARGPSDGAARRGKPASTWQRFRRHRPALLGLALLALIILGCVGAPLIFGYDPYATALPLRRQPPSLEHLCGTDELGRDLLMRLWVGGRVSLLIGFAAMLISIGIGTLVGAAAGFYGKWIDNALMRCADFLLALPNLFALLLAAQIARAMNLPEIGDGLLPLIVIIGTLSWMGTARLVRGQFLAIQVKEYIDAARVAGARNARIMFRHILPNAVSPIIVSATLQVGNAIITEATLSFLGYGAQPPLPSWGNLLKTAQAQMTTAPWLALFPGALILLTVLAINYIGDGLRDACDPSQGG